MLDFFAVTTDKKRLNLKKKSVMLGVQPRM